MQLEKLLLGVVRLESVNIYKCDQCTKVFTSQCDLKKHLVHHNNIFLLHTKSAYVLLEKIKTDPLLKNYNYAQKTLKNGIETPRLSLENITNKPFKYTPYENNSIVQQSFPHLCYCGVGFYELRDLKHHKILAHLKEITELVPQKKQHQSENYDFTKSKMKIDLQQKLYSKTSIPKIDLEMKIVRDKYECPECKNLYASPRNLQIHYRTHLGYKPYQCHLCSKCFNQNTTLKNHITKHSSEKNYVCCICKKAFKNNQYLTRHKIIHNDLKPYVCRFCNKGFNDGSARWRHTLIHTNDKQYKCPTCPKSFNYSSALNSHKRRHFEQKFKCKICNKMFYEHSDLKRHSIVHTNVEKKIECDYCHKRYTQKNYLAVHIKRVHT